MESQQAVSLVVGMTEGYKVKCCGSTAVVCSGETC